MNTIHRWMCGFLAATCLLISAALMDGPDETEAAQDVFDDAADAHLQAAMEECRARLGADAQMFMLDGQHLVCRAAASVKTAGGQP